MGARVSPSLSANIPVHQLRDSAQISETVLTLDAGGGEF